MSGKNYVDNKKFLAALIEYYKQCEEAEERGEELPRVTNYIGKSLQDIAYGIARRPNFSSYSYKDEMIADGIENALKAIHNFDPSKAETPNPFGYFSRVIWFAFLRRIEDEHREVYNKYKATEKAYIDGDISELTAGGIVYNDYMEEFVTNYEKKLEKRRTQQKERKNLDKLMSENQD